MVPASVQTLVSGITSGIINPIIGILFALALFYFLYGLAMFIFNADDSGKKVEARQHAIWGLIGLFIMLSAYALIQVGLETFGLDEELYFDP